MIILYGLRWRALKTFSLNSENGQILLYCPRGILKRSVLKDGINTPLAAAPLNGWRAIWRTMSYWNVLMITGEVRQNLRERLTVFQLLIVLPSSISWNPQPE